jgi:HlyD family secretion protein
MARQVEQSRGGGGSSAAGGGGGRRNRGAARAQHQTVYKLPTGREDPAPVDVKTGISDGRFTQVVDGQLAAGDTVVTGLATAKAESAGGAIGGAGRGGPGGGRRGF